MSAWENIRTAIADVFSDVNDLSSNQFTETPMGVEIDKLPEPKINGAYSIHMAGFPQAHREANQTILPELQVRIQVGFVMNNRAVKNQDGVLENEKPDYKNAVNDIVLIVKTLLLGNYPTFEIKDFAGGSEMRFINNSETYAVCDLVFSLGARE